MFRAIEVKALEAVVLHGNCLDVFSNFIGSIKFASTERRHRSSVQVGSIFMKNNRLYRDKKNDIYYYLKNFTQK